MTYRIFLVVILLLATSCQFFETEKVSSEEIFKDEIKTINWKDVDRYPSFPNCEKTLDKSEQQECFIKIVSNHLYQVVRQKNLIAGREIQDTVNINFEVSSSGKLSILEMKMDSLLQKDFPHLKTAILKSIDSLQPIAPAYKRGIPVKTKFTLPVIIQTD